MKKHYAIISENGTKYTYYQMESFKNTILGILNKDSLILICCDVCCEAIMMYVACLQSRIRIMFSNTKTDFVKNCINTYKPNYVWTNSQYVGENYINIWCFEKYYLYEQIHYDPIKMNDDLAMLLNTSGSTGSSKYARISYKNIDENTKAIAKSLEITDKDRAMVMLPMQYTYGLSVINSNLYKGATLLVPTSDFKSVNFWKFASEYNCTSIAGVPLMYDYLKSFKFGKNLIPNMRLATQAGGPLNIETEKYMLKKAVEEKFDFAVMYGQTEATARMTCHFINRNPNKIGSVGKVIPGGKIYVKNNELVYEGENVCLGYANNIEELKRGNEFNGTLKTGDLGYIDSDGFVFVTGRKKRISKIAGVRVNLDELQKKIQTDLCINAVCVELSNVLAVVSNMEIDKKMVEDYLKSLLGIGKFFIRVGYINQYPINLNGKVDYNKIKKYMENNYQ